MTNIGEIEIGFVKRAHGPDVFPVTLEDVGMDMSIFNRLRDDVFAEIGQVVVQAFTILKTRVTALSGHTL